MSLVKGCLEQLKKDLAIVDKYNGSGFGAHHLSDRVHNTINKILTEVSYFEKRDTELPINIECIQWNLNGEGEIKFKLKDYQDISQLNGRKFKIVYLE